MVAVRGHRRWDSRVWSNIATRIREVGRGLLGLARTADLDEQDAAQLTSGVVHRLIWCPPQEAYAVGWRTTLPSEAGASTPEDVTAQLDRHLGLQAVVVEARGTARAGGCAWLYLVPEDEDDDPADPLEPGTPLGAIHVLGRREVGARSYVQSMASRDWLRPEILDVTIHRDGVSVPTHQVHASRLIYVPGLPRTADWNPATNQNANDGCRNLSVIDLYWPIVQDLEMGWRATATGLERRGMPILSSVAALGAKVSARAEELDIRLDAFNRALNAFGVMIAGPGETLTFTAPPQSGTAETLGALAARLSSVEGFPLVKLMGQPPAGLTSDDRSGQRTWNALLQREQEVMTPVLEQVYTMALGVDDRRTIEWAAVGAPDQLEAAQIDAQNAARDESLIRTGAIHPAESRARYKGAEVAPRPVLSKAYDVEPDDELLAPEPEEPVPSTEPELPIAPEV